MKSFIALSFVLTRLLTSAYALQTAVAVTEPQRIGANIKDALPTAFLNHRASDEPITVSTPRAPGEYGVFFATIGFGDPVKYSRLIIDTGSSITWSKKYIDTVTTKPTGRQFKLYYGSDEYCRADEVLDQVTIAPNLVISDQAVGAAIKSSYFDGLDGILGLGPVALTKGKIRSERDATVPTVMNKLKSSGLISKEIFSIYFPYTAHAKVADDGKLTFGGVDESLYEGEIRYVSITQNHRGRKYWGINLISCTYGDGDSEKTIFRKPEVTVAGIMDTGSNLIYLAQDMFEPYMDAIPGATYDEDIDMMEIPPDSIKHMQPLHFKLGDHVFTLDVDAQLLPPEMNDSVGGDPDKRYGLITSDGPDTRTGSGRDFILGVPFMKVYYTVFDADNKRLGFATAKHIKDSQPPTDERA